MNEHHVAGHVLQRRPRAPPAPTALSAHFILPLLSILMWGVIGGPRESFAEHISSDSSAPEVLEDIVDLLAEGHASSCEPSAFPTPSLIASLPPPPPQTHALISPPSRFYPCASPAFSRHNASPQRPPDSTPAPSASPLLVSPAPKLQHLLRNRDLHD